ncbi:hypothetical protein DRO47_05495 [Candidatus Bathyarchaeota archaeon]|nr:MAG: hypothetical protein DRO47_05495 [Candidatus Bathyarchaeota archaeon]
MRRFILMVLYSNHKLPLYVVLTMLGKILVLLLAGVLSVFYAEVLSGSSPLWFLDFFGYLFLLPLYMFHLLILYNIAVRSSRLSERSLYLFGVIFGLYESWMTKVIWAGFPESEGTMFGRILGFAVGELGIITFFWHPLMSFIAPLVTIEILSVHLGNSDVSRFPSEKLLEKRKVSMFFYYLILIFSAGALALNAGNIITSLLGLLGTLLIIFVLYKLITLRDKSLLSLNSLLVGRKALILMILYLGALYWLFFVSIRPEEIPSIQTMILTVFFYIFVALLIYLDKPAEGEGLKKEKSCLGFGDLRKFYALTLILVVVFSFIAELTLLILMVFFLVIIAVGYVMFFYTILDVLRK